MRIQRSNPWPALADLFAALLISTFGGLVMIGSAGARQPGSAPSTANKDEQIATLTETVQALEEKKEEAEAKVKLVSDKLNKCEEDRSRLAESLEAQQTQLPKARGGKGLGLPPCLEREGRPLPLIEITVSDDGVEVRNLPQPEYEQRTSAIAGLQTLTEAGKISDEEFRDLAGPIAAWGRNSDNTLGFSCAFYATLKPGTVSKSRLSTARAYVEDRFYIFNAMEVNRFMKAKEN
jgi:hypothetical protein